MHIKFSLYLWYSTYIDNPLCGFDSRSYMEVTGSNKEGAKGCIPQKTE